MTDLSRQLAEWSAAEAAGERARERSLRQQLLESATLAGLLVDVAERNEPAAVVLRGGAGVRSGAVTSVGRDFVVLDRTLIPFEAIAVVRAEAVSGSRAPSSQLSFAAAVARLAEDRPRVSVAVDGGDVVSGELQAAGDGLVALTTGWIAMAAIRSLTLV